MTGLEMENFYSKDQKKYIINENEEILNFIKECKKKNIPFSLEINEIQKLIEYITLFFEFKYPDNFLDELSNNICNNNTKTCNEIAKTLNMEHLKYRLHHDYKLFLDCPYGCYFNLVRKKYNLCDINHLFIKIENDGTINEFDLNEIYENKFLYNINGIDNADDLLGRFIGNPIDVDYRELEKAVVVHKMQIKLRNMVLQTIPLRLIYSTNTFPEYGYIRAKSFIRMINREYKIDISLNEVEEIMKADYSDINDKIKTLNK